MILRTLAALAFVLALAVPAQRAAAGAARSGVREFPRRTLEGRAGQRHHARDLRQGLRWRHARPARDRHHQEQPEYNKPAGAYVNQLASPLNAKTGLRKEAEWRTTFDAIEKKYQVERWVILAIWGMETSYGALKDKWDGIRSLATLAFAKYRDPVFPQRASGRAADHPGRPHLAREIRQLMGRRDGPDPVHADEFRRLRRRLQRRRPPRHLDQCAGRARLDRELFRQGGGRLEDGHALGLRGLDPARAST